MNRPSSRSPANRTASKSGDPIERVRYGLLIALLIASVVVISGVVVFLVVAYTSASSTTVSSLALPYNIQNRPLPDAQNVSTDLPRTVGRFTQTAVSGKLNGIVGQLSATYTSGADSIQMTLDLNANNAQGLGAFQKRLFTFKQSHIDTQQDLGVAYAQAVDPATHMAHLIYLKQYWLIDVTANSQAALDAFMTAYSY